MAIAQSTTGAVRIDEATLERDRRASEQSMGVWEIADAPESVGTGDDWRFRGEPGRGEIARCKHLARVEMVLEEVHPPADTEVCRSLEAQRERSGGRR